MKKRARSGPHRAHLGRQQFSRHQTRRCQQLSIDQDVFEQWCRIGRDQGLSTPTEIAKFLIKQYEDKLRRLQSRACCVHCKTPFTLVCVTCLKGFSSGSEELDHAGCTKPSKNLKTQQAFKSSLLNVSVAVKRLDLEDTPCVKNATSSCRDSVKVSQVPSDNAECDLMASDAPRCATEQETAAALASVSDDETADDFVLGNDDDHKCDKATVIASPTEFPQSAVTSELVPGGENSITSGEKSAALREQVPEESRVNVSNVTLETVAATHSGRPQRKGAVYSVGKLKVPSDIETDSDSEEEDDDVDYGKSTLKSKKRKDDGESEVTSMKKKRKNTTFTCKVCLASFGAACVLREHQLLHSKKTPFKCDICSQRFKNRGLRYHHQVKHRNGSMPVKCDECRYCFMTEESLKDHKWRQHEQASQCQLCGRNKFRTPKSLARHIRKHYGEKDFICDKCGRTFDLKGRLIQHLMKEHADSVVLSSSELSAVERKFVCEVCGKKLKTSKSLESHRLLHSADKPFKCPHCNAAFRTEATLNTHVKGHTREKSFICQQCGKAFSCLSTLRKHELIHTGIRPHSCDICHARFLYHSKLMDHVKRKHDFEKPHQCSHCPLKFFCVSELKVHNRVHTGEKPCICDICGAAFGRCDYLLKHKAVHTGETPYVCSECGVGFRQRMSLTRHMKSHSQVPVPPAATSFDLGTGGQPDTVAVTVEIDPVTCMAGSLVPQ